MLEILLMSSLCVSLMSLSLVIGYLWGSKRKAEDFEFVSRFFLMGSKPVKESKDIKNVETANLSNIPLEQIEKQLKDAGLMEEVIPDPYNTYDV